MIFDNRRANSEGWGLFETEEGWEIQRLDEGAIGEDREPTGRPVFDSDQEAKMFVIQQGLCGSEYHWDAYFRYHLGE